MAQPTPVPVPLEQTRQSIIQQLTEHFAYDNLSVEALEERLDRAHAGHHAWTTCAPWSATSPSSRAARGRDDAPAPT